MGFFAEFPAGVRIVGSIGRDNGLEPVHRQVIDAERAPADAAHHRQRLLACLAITQGEAQKKKSFGGQIRLSRILGGDGHSSCLVLILLLRKTETALRSARLYGQRRSLAFSGQYCQMFDIATETVVLLGFAAFFAGFMDAIAGGGGLVTVPALLLAGLSPVESLATNKLQSIFGTASAVAAYARKGHVDIKAQLPWACLAFIAGVCGAFLANVIPGQMLEAALPPLLIGVAIFFALKPRVDDLDRARRISPLLFGLTVVPIIAFYDGAFGPGTGSFFMLSFVVLAGFGVLKATAHTKVLNFASNIGSFVAFVFVGVMHWKIGLVMGVAQFAGARLGAALAMRKGAAIIKPLLITVCIALAIRLLTQEDNALLAYLGF